MQLTYGLYINHGFVLLFHGFGQLGGVEVSFVAIQKVRGAYENSNKSVF